jgi:hypothetical protein
VGEVDEEEMTRDVEVMGIIDELVIMDDIDEEVVGGRLEVVLGTKLVDGITAVLMDGTMAEDDDDSPVNVTMGVKLENMLLLVVITGVGVELSAGCNEMLRFNRATYRMR